MSQPVMDAHPGVVVLARSSVVAMIAALIAGSIALRAQGPTAPNVGAVAPPPADEKPQQPLFPAEAYPIAAGFSDSLSSTV